MSDKTEVDVEVMPEITRVDLLIWYVYCVTLFAIVPGTLLLAFIGAVLKMVKDIFYS